MADSPDDIAWRIVGAWNEDWHEATTVGVVEAIASAIKAERERADELDRQLQAALCRAGDA